MEFKSQIILWRKLWLRSSLTLALVGCLAMYHQTVLTNTVTLVQKRWRTDAAVDPDNTKALPSRDRIVLWTPNLEEEVSQSQNSHCSWKKFFKRKKK